MTLRLVTLLVVLSVFHSGSAFAAAADPSPTPSTQRTVTFTWNASSSEQVLGYKLYWGTGSKNYQNAMDVKIVFSHSLILNTTTEYYVAAKAYNSSGESALSNEVVVPAVSSPYY